jgi:transcriptional regulator NrdR family protein
VIEKRLIVELIASAIKSLTTSAGNDDGKRHQQARILFRLATIEYSAGTHAPATQEGRSASQAIRQIADEFEKTPPTDQPQPRQTGDTWFPPTTSVPTTPEVVIKRPKINLSDDGKFERLVDRVTYDAALFHKSLIHAFIGRPDVDQMSHCVQQWVLWGLVGQKVVQSSQIHAAVTECLRRVDDVAYIRWSVISRRLDVDEVLDEIEMLRRYPSKALTFDVSGTPEMRPATDR